MTRSVVLRDFLGGEVARLRGDRFAGISGGAEAIVYRGRVFRLPSPEPDDGDVVMVETSTVVLETPFVCPWCAVERADYEGEPGRYLPTCPNCGSGERPIPCGLSFNSGRGHRHDGGS